MSVCTKQQQLYVGLSLHSLQFIHNQSTDQCSKSLIANMSLPVVGVAAAAHGTL